VPSDSHGIQASLIRIPGRKAHLLGKVVLDNVEVPASALIGGENQAFKVMRGRWDYSRCNVGLMSIGAATRALEDVMGYSKRRKTFGSPLAKWESIQFRIVDNHISLEAARWLAYRALWMHDQGMRAMKEGSMVKIFATTAALKAIIDVHMIHGASGLNIELPYEKVHRDIMSLYVTGGGVDIHKIVVGSELLGTEFTPYK
jgi:alkylation response protein AidB-like acyl-CoA dehydrogenase